MTVTPAKLAANRANSKRSTGPRTAAGKERARMNGATHGIFCNDLVLPHECSKEFKAFRDAFVLELRPLSIVELMLVDRIVSASWKLKRVNRIEALVTGRVSAGDQEGAGRGADRTRFALRERARSVEMRSHLRRRSAGGRFRRG